MVCRPLIIFFFFKQKTAYEMRISDWSSDVCSSDLQILHYAEPFGLFGLWVPGPDTGMAQDDVRAAMAGFAMEQAPHPHTGVDVLRLRIPAGADAQEIMPSN